MIGLPERKLPPVVEQPRLLISSNRNLSRKLLSALKQRQDEADGSVWIDYALHMTINNSKPETLAQIPALSENGITSYKLYTTYDGMKLSYQEISVVMKSIAASGGICMVHAEDDSVIQSAVSDLVKAGKLSSRWFPFSRPPEAEIKAVDECIQLAEESGVILYLVHLSTGKAVEAVVNARAAGLQVVAETCPQYLLLNQTMITEGDPFTAAALICSPALKSEDENSLALECNNSKPTSKYWQRPLFV